jgi:hypothetical protein
MKKIKTHRATKTTIYMLYLAVRIARFASGDLKHSFILFCKEKSLKVKRKPRRQ